jgi:hypothetical protein
LVESVGQLGGCIQRAYNSQAPQVTWQSVIDCLWRYPENGNEGEKFLSSSDCSDPNNIAQSTHHVWWCWCKPTVPVPPVLLKCSDAVTLCCAQERAAWGLWHRTPGWHQQVQVV